MIDSNTIFSDRNNASTTFYRSGGTLAPDEPSYIRRAADANLLDGLQQGQFCYVLTSRQMGKSSLMNQTATRLRKDGTVVAELDLTSIGQNLTLEQWYDGLVYEIGRRLNLKAQLKACWQANEHLGPLHRFMAVLLEGVLVQCSGPVVIFVDEIEVVRSLPFSTDEFFAAIRECYNRRATDASMRRLTFCLLGMATPQDLIQDPRITPFNIGRRVELTDFTINEAEPLAQGLQTQGRDGKQLLSRVLYWTNGHPYLTQCICQAIAEDLSITTYHGVDRVCKKMFLSAHARESDANLAPVGEYILRSMGDIAAILEVYRKIHLRKCVPDDTTNPIVSFLQLSGITRVSDGRLLVRNRIYHDVFDRSWILTNMPYAELQRQKAAFRRGLLRAAAIFSIIAIIMAALTTEAIRQASIANKRERETHQLLYFADINLAGQALDRHNIARVVQILHTYKTEKLRGFEYGYMWRMCHRDYFTSYAEDGVVQSVAFSPDGNLIATSGQKGTIRIWDRPKRRLLHSLQRSSVAVTSVAFSNNGKWLAASAYDHTVTIWDAKTYKLVCVLRKHTQLVNTVAFSSDSKLLATGGFDQRPIIWNTLTWLPIRILKGHQGAIYSLVFSPKNDLLASASGDNTVKIWNVASGILLRTLAGHTKVARCVAFNADGTRLASGSEDNTAIVWDTGTWKKLHTIYNDDQNICAIAFSPATGELVTAGTDDAIKFWNVANETTTAIFDGHTYPIASLAFSPDGRWVASASWDGTAKIWDTWTERRDYVRITGANPYLSNSVLSPHGTMFAADVGTGQVQVWNAISGRIMARLPKYKDVIQAIAFSGNDSELAIASNQTHVDIYDTATATLVCRLDCHQSDITALALSETGNRLATGSNDGASQVWSRTGDVITLLATQHAPSKSSTQSLAFSVDDTDLAAGYENASALVWNLLYKSPPRVFLGHRGSVNAVAFSPDGRTLITGSGDSTIKLWNIETQREIIMLLSRSGMVTSVAQSPSGETLKTVNAEGTIRIWRSKIPLHSDLN